MLNHEVLSCWLLLWFTFYLSFLVWTAPQFAFFLAPAGAFNPNQEDPLPGRMKKQLVLKIISGQQLPKPKDSMLGDRGEVGHVLFLNNMLYSRQKSKEAYK